MLLVEVEAHLLVHHPVRKQPHPGQDRYCHLHLLASRFLRRCGPHLCEEEIPCVASSPFLEVSLLFLEETHGVAESPDLEGNLSLEVSLALEENPFLAESHVLGESHHLH